MVMQDKYANELLPVCQTLHMIWTGSYEGPSLQDIRRTAEWLRRRVVAWEPSVLGRTAVYDAMVYALVVETLREIDLWLGDFEVTRE